MNSKNKQKHSSRECNTFLYEHVQRWRKYNDPNIHASYSVVVYKHIFLSPLLLFSLAKYTVQKFTLS